MADLDLADRHDYTHFLSLQLAARVDVEEWALANCAQDLCPPAMVPLIRDDLKALDASDHVGHAQVQPPAEFTLPPGAGCLGLSWALAGSHLGNRAMLADLRKRANEQDMADLPTSFLADEQMIAFWKRLLPRLTQCASEREAAPAIAAASAVFEHFGAVFLAPASRNNHCA